MRDQAETWEVALLLRGLEWAHERCAAAQQPGQEVDPVRAPLSAWEFAGWACALDEWLGEQRGTDYKARRDRDPEGRLLLGIRFARDRHVHQATLFVVHQVTFRFAPEGVRIEMPKLSWRILAHVAEPTDGHESRPMYLHQRRAYEADLADRPVLPTMEAALRFLTAEVSARGVR